MKYLEVLDFHFHRKDPGEYQPRISQNAAIEKGVSQNFD
jgi:hypothetical protein